MRSDGGTSKYLTAGLHFLFFLSGIAAVFIGQILPILGRHFALDDLRLGYFFPAQFAGSLTGTLLTGWFSRRKRLADAAWIGAGLMAAGILGMNAGSYELVLIAFVVNGLGIGLTLPSINLLVLEINPERTASALAVLNFCWGVGAIVCKPFVDLTAGDTTIGVTTAIVSAAMLASGVLILVFRVRRSVSSPAEMETPETPAVTPIWTTPTAWTIALFNFIHVGFESGIGGWLTTYAVRVDPSGHVGIFTPTFLFFLFFVIGRGSAPIFFRFLDENAMLLASLLTILVGMVIAMTAANAAVLGVGSAIAGLGTSSVFPTNVARFYRIYGAEAMRRAMPLFLFGTLGGAAVTYSIGFLSNYFESLRAGMFLLLFNIAILIVIQIALTAKTAKPQTDPGSV